jgi:hypothetical protein
MHHRDRAQHALLGGSKDLLLGAEDGRCAPQPGAVHPRRGASAIDAPHLVSRLEKSGPQFKIHWNCLGME